MLKMIPYYRYQLDAIEGWLDEQAQKGLILDDRSGTLFSFKKSEPKVLRYRIDVKPGFNDADDKARISNYREMGWEYVCSLSSRADIYVCADPTATELNTDEGTLHEVLDKLLITDIWISAIGTVLIPLLWTNTLLLQGWDGYSGIYDRMINGMSTFLFPMALLSIFLLTLPMAMTLCDAVRTYRRLLLTRDYHTVSRAQKRRALNRFRIAAPVMILVALLVLWGYTQSDRDITAEAFGPTVTVLFPGHPPASFRPHSDNVPEEMLWVNDLPLIHAARARQHGFEQSDPNDEFNRRPIWTYNADLQRIHSKMLAEKYAAEQAESRDMEPVNIQGWENAWFLERADTREGRNTFAQEVLLQNGKDVWRFGYWTYDNAPQYKLLDAVKSYVQASSAAHTG